MESLLPSEIARLVYGYLEDEGCKDAASAFLKKSLHLKECLSVANKGRKFNSRIHGLKLTDLFELLTEAVSFANEQKRELKVSKAKKKYPLLSSFISENLLPSSNGEQAREGKGASPGGCDSTISSPQNTKRAGRGQSDMDHRNRSSSKSVCTKKSSESSDNCFKSSFSNHDGHQPSPGIRVKEENVEDCEEVVESIVEPQVEIQTLEGSVSGVVGPPQIFCQPFASPVLQLLPPPTVFFPQLLPQHTLPSPTPTTFGPAPTRMTTCTAVQPVLPKTKTPPSQHNTGGSKLRPIAPKLTQPVNNGVQVQVIQKKDPQLESPNRTLRPRKRRKFIVTDATCTLFFNNS